MLKMLKVTGTFLSARRPTVDVGFATFTGLGINASSDVLMISFRRHRRLRWIHRTTFLDII